MAAPSTFNAPRTILFISLGIGLFILLGYVFTSIYVYVSVSLVLTAMLRPLVNYVASAAFFGVRFPRVIAVFLAFGFLLSLLAFFALLFIPLINEQIDTVSSLEYNTAFDNFSDQIENLEDFLIENELADPFLESGTETVEPSQNSFPKPEKTSNEGLKDTLGSVSNVDSVLQDSVFTAFQETAPLVDTANEEKEIEHGFLLKQLQDAPAQLFGSFDVSNFLTSLLSITGNVLLGILAVSFITFFFLLEKGLVRRNIISLIPNRYFEVSIGGLYKIERLLSNYLIGLLIQMTTIFTLASIGLSIVGVKYAMTVALFAAVANLIPYAGPLLGGIFGVIVGISTSADLNTTSEYMWLVFFVFLVFSLVQLADNLIIQPLIFSKSVKAHPLEIFIIIFAGATLGGITGMIVAIPVYTVIRVSVKELYEGYRSYHIFKTK
ncbi:MAG: AI-2E family transporter [Bacteroidota bacterium]